MPDGSSNNRANDIINLCKELWPAHKSDCSGFVNAVAAALKIPLSGNADAIVARIKLGPWEALTDGLAAKNAADNGKFVIGGLAAASHQPPRDHGHVVVVVSGPLDSTHNRYPTAYWGSLGSIGKENQTLNWAWREADRDRLIYAACVV